jgi:uncharacterized protein
VALNSLAGEKSPYLLQHAANPVHWFPWGTEAQTRAREEDKPIFLSIGYATCHWCHVMAHESFEDEDVARLLNDHYVAVKVDREERPDVDQIYMAACQALTGQGGWPLSVFLTPDGKPFYAGTYFPKTSRFGRPGFIDLLNQLHLKWRENRDIVLKAADQLTQALEGPEMEGLVGELPGREALNLGIKQLTNRFDPQWGGFGPAPKFPTPHHLNFLLRMYDRNHDEEILSMVEKTLTAMRQGGIFDHLGLGFHRYSVDERWLVPHFEKMLYDQALLALAAAETYQAATREFYAEIVREIFTYVLRDMTGPEGGFYTAEDADSEGKEGAFYVWRREEIITELGPEIGPLFCEYYHVTRDGNFEHGLNVLHTTEDLSVWAKHQGLDPGILAGEFARARDMLYTVRERRPKPLKDDKILSGWNGLMIAALAKGAQALADDRYARAASRAADFILTALMTPEHRLRRRYRDGEVAHPGYLEDYAFMVWGLIELYESMFNTRYLREAIALTDVMLNLFWDDNTGGFFFTGRENEPLISRKKELYDGALPSGNSVAFMNLLRLTGLTGRTDFREKAELMARAFSEEISRYPGAHTHALMAVDFMTGPALEIVIAEGRNPEAAHEMAGAIHQTFMPRKTLLYRPTEPDLKQLTVIAPFVQSMGPVNGLSTYYRCRSFACLAPLTEPVEVIADIQRMHDSTQSEA